MRRFFLALVAALLCNAGSIGSVAAEKIGLQSVKKTGERVGVQAERNTGEKIGLQKTEDTDSKLGLQTPEKPLDAAAADVLWDLYIDFDADGTFITSDSYSRLRKVADLLLESPSMFIYVQGLALEDERDREGMDLAERRAALAMAYLQLFGVDSMTMELVQPRTGSAKRMEEQASRHEARRAAASKRDGTTAPPALLRGVRFGVVEQH